MFSPPYSFNVEKWDSDFKGNIPEFLLCLVSLKKKNGGGGGGGIKPILASYFIFFCGFFPSSSSEHTQPSRSLVFFASVTIVYIHLCYIPTSHNHMFLNSFCTVTLYGQIMPL